MSNVGDNERLMVLVEARITDLERNMKKASATTGREFGNMRRQSGSATRDMERDIQRAATRINQSTTSIAGSIGSMSRAFATGLVGGIAAMGVTGIVSQMRQTAESIAMIGSEAQRAGVSAKAFQELGYVASQNRIPVDALVDGLKELNLRTDELLLTGTGPAAESFHRLGFTAEELKEKLRDPSSLLVEIIGRLQQLDRASQIRISDELFGGTAGERFVELIDDGAEGIRDMIQDANDLGLVMDEQMIAKADEVDRKFKMIAQTVGSGLRSAIVSAADALWQFIEQFRAFENQSADARARTLGGRLQDIAAQRQTAENEIRALRVDPNDPVGGLLAGANERALIPLQEANLRRLRAEEQQVRRLMEAESMDALRRMPAPRPEIAPSTLNSEPFDPGKEKREAAAGKKAAGAADRDAKAREREAEAVRQLIADLEEEQRLIGATDVERGISNALRQAGAEATDQQRNRIRELVTAIEEETLATEGLKAAQEEMADVGREAFRTILDGFKNGASAAEIMTDVVGRLSDRLIDMSLEGLFASGKGGMGTGGSILGALGSIFGGFRANGGPVRSDRAYVVGERGPELFMPTRAGAIVPNHALAPPRPTSSITVTNNPVFNIDAKGATPDTVADLERRMGRMIADNNKALERNLGSMIANGRAMNRPGF